jgi:outer membrane receptor protein involved in Fe transport
MRVNIGYSSTADERSCLSNSRLPIAAQAAADMLSVHPGTVALYANNLFDNQYATGIQTISASTLGTPFTNITPPRFWGAELGVHF